MDPALVQRIAHRKVKVDLAVVDYDPTWREHFETFRLRILRAFHEPNSASRPAPVHVHSVDHVGSTSVLGLPAKAVIDIDLVLSSNSLEVEPYYIPRLEEAGFQYLLREPEWYGHRFLVGTEPMSCNLHVWGPKCPEVARHRIFIDWLRKHEEDREAYAKIKRQSVRATNDVGGDVMDYNERKQGVLRSILDKAIRAGAQSAAS